MIIISAKYDVLWRNFYYRNKLTTRKVMINLTERISPSVMVMNKKQNNIYKT